MPYKQNRCCYLASRALDLWNGSNLKLRTFFEVNQLDFFPYLTIPPAFKNWLVVSTRLKNISQIRSFPQVRGENKNISNHHRENG